VFDARQSNMQDLTTYSPIRIGMTGFWQVVVGALLAIPAGMLVYIGPSGERMANPPAGEPYPWYFFAFGLVLLFCCVYIFAGGVGRIRSAFAENCYFRAGTDGIAIRLPKPGWFGRFQIIEYNIKWSEIKELVHFTYRVNLIPVTRELRIFLNDGKKITIDRKYFSASVKKLQEQLLTIQASVSGAPVSVPKEPLKESFV
jgi:hypothetical protein